MAVDKAFLVKPSELTLKYDPPPGQRLLSFKNASRSLDQWQTACKQKLTELLGVQMPKPAKVTELRQAMHEGVQVKLVVMQVSDGLSIPAYLLLPAKDARPGTAIMAIHGHGTAEGCLFDHDYHHDFPVELAKAGNIVLCPALRGFGALADLAAGLEGHRLDYWNWGKIRAYSLATDAFQRGQTLIGMTVEDLLRWEAWLAESMAVKKVVAVGISYGGDLALTYPVFSSRVSAIFASGSLGSFDPIFARCYNAPAHCIPGVLNLMDRADIAGLNAPRPITLQYGELDKPSKDNFSASYNETVAGSITELKAIYAKAGVEDRVKLVVTPNQGHVMDVTAAKEFLAGLDAR
jgi:dienelactone hydrolase